MDIDVLVDLGPEQLEKLGIAKLGPAVKLVQAAKAFKAAEENPYFAEGREWREMKWYEPNPN